MTNFCNFYIVRHGQSEWNVKKLIQGQYDSVLTPEGEMQGKKIAQLLKDVPFAGIFSSDLQRARKTAEAIAAEHGLPVTVSHLLRERSFGHMEGQPRENFSLLLQKYDAVPASERFSFKPFPDVESDEEILNRFYLFIKKTASSFTGKNVLVATHIGIMRILLRELGFVSQQNRFTMNVANTGYIEMKSDGTTHTVEKTYGITTT